MRRESSLERIGSAGAAWDIAVVGGGATGVSVALDAATRGYSVVLLEQADFGQGTSSRSTKLVHGGVRYLQQGNIALVREALRERGRLLRNAPHLVHSLDFIVPSYRWWEAAYYGAGLKVYDLLAGQERFGASELLGSAECMRRLPTLRQDGLRGGVLYRDGQFDDARLLLTLARTAAEAGACLVNYAPVTALKPAPGLGGTAGRRVVARDAIGGREFEFEARCVINATGPFTDAVRRLDAPEDGTLVTLSQGAHVILPRDFLPGETALMVPRTTDGRVMFAIPWHGHTLVGTTEIPADSASNAPCALDVEIDFLLETAARFLARAPRRDDILSVFAGLRPLVGKTGEKSTAKLSRGHFLHVSSRGLITLTGGKWTTCRAMAEDAVTRAAAVAGLKSRRCETAEMRLHGWHGNAASFGDLSVYGADAPVLRRLAAKEPELAEPLHPQLPIIGARVAWAARHEMAQTVDDVLSRRTRALFLHARAAAAIAPKVAHLLARELGRSEAWQREQVAKVQRTATTMLPATSSIPHASVSC